MKAAGQASPATVGIEVADWNGKVVRAFLAQRFRVRLSKTTCVDYLHRLGFVVKRPKKCFLKADEAKRDAFVAAYAVLLREARERGEKLFFADEAHFRADADLRGKWVLKGQPALVDSTSPRWGEKVSYYSAVCLETGKVEGMDLEGNSTAETAAAFLQHLRERHPEPLVVVWDNSPAPHGDALRAYPSTPTVRRRLITLPAYSPDFNGDEAVWDWARDEVTANTCLGTKAKVQGKLGAFFTGLTQRTEEGKRRCRTVLQARAEALLASPPQLPLPQHGNPTPVLV